MSLSQQSQHAKVDQKIYNKMSKPIRCAAAELWDPKNAPAEIDVRFNAPNMEYAMSLTTTESYP